MPTQTPLDRKDAALDDSIVSMRQTLQDFKFDIVEQNWRNPVANVWSLEVCDRSCPMLSAKGNGTSKKAALASALSKFIERLSNHSFWVGIYFGDEIANNKYIHYPNETWCKTNSNGSWPDDVLNDALRGFYNPDGELNASKLIETNSSNRERGICCLPMASHNTSELINFPINIIDNLYASNGTGVGNTIDEAGVNALSEILETYIKFKVIAEGISLPNIPEAILQKYPSIQESVNAIETTGFTLLIQDASLDGKYPVVAMTLLNPKDQGINISFGAHPKFETALKRCLTTLLQDRELEEMDGFSEAGFDMDEIASPKNLENHFNHSNGPSGIIAWTFLKDKPDYEFIDWSNKYSNINTAEEFKQLSKIVTTDSHDIYISSNNEMGIYTCRVLVPGMSEIYPVDDLVWENDNAGMDVRPQILKSNKTIDECEELIETLEDLNQDDQYLVSTLIGLPADKECIFHDLCVAELITLLALKTQDNERIQEGCEWLIHYKKIDSRRLKTYQCINAILQLDGMTNYSTALEKLYSRSVLNDALALIAGEDVFPLESKWEMHGLLIEAYKKIRKNS